MITKDLLDKRISVLPCATASHFMTPIKLREYFNIISRDSSYSGAIKYRDVIKSHGKDHANSKYFKANNILCVMPSGTFLERNDNGLDGEFTGVVVLDLDAKDNIGIDIDNVVKDSKLISNTIAYHKSVSGEGYAIYVLVDEWKKNTYKFVRDFYTAMLGVTFDKSTSNLSRLRYVSTDPDIWVSETVEPLMIPNVIPKKKDSYVPLNEARSDNSDKIIIDLIDTVISNGDDPTSDYGDWFTLGCAIASWLGEGGRDYFHKVSSNYYGYNYTEVDSKYDSILSLGRWKAGKGSIVYILSQYQ